jgi:hypothetical protein
MLTLIGTFLGFFSGVLPEFLKIWRAKDDRKHELAILDMQMKMAAQGSDLRLNEINTQADIRQEELALEASKIEPLPLSGKWWVDVPATFANTLLLVASGLVRPVITYSYFGLYSLVKFAQYKTVLMAGGVTQWQTITGLWSTEDSAIFGTVIGFWYGSRSLKYFKTLQK